MPTRRHLVPVVATALLFLASCGDDDGEGSDSTSAAAAADLLSESSPAPSGDTDPAATDLAATASTAGDTAVTGDDVVPVCDLVSAASVEAAYGGAPTSVSPPVEGAVNASCVWSFESAAGSASLGLLYTEFPTVAEADAYLAQQVTGARFSPVPYDGLGEQAVVVDGDTGIRVAARQGAIVLDMTGFAVGRPLPTLDVYVALMQEALASL